MVRVLQVMNRAGDSTAAIGRLIAKEVKRFRFENCYLQGEAPRGEVSMGFSGRAISGLFRYFSVSLMFFRFYQFKPDLIMAHRFKCLHFGLLLARLFARPLMVVVHGVGDYDRPYRQRLLKSAIARGARVVCVSNYVADYLKGVLGTEVSSAIAVIENSVDYLSLSSDLHTRNDARNALGVGEQAAFVVAYVGRLVGVKGVEDFVEAACRFNQPGVEFVVVGDGALRTGLEARAAAEIACGRIRFVGFVPQAYRVLKGVDLLVMPSRSEGFPIALLEAMSADTPVLVSDIAVYQEILGNDDCFYRSEDIDALVLALERKFLEFNNKSLFASASQRAERLRQAYPYAGFVRGYENLIRQMLS